MRNLILRFRDWFGLMTMSQQDAAEYLGALREIHAGVHAAVDAVPTPDEVFEGISRRERIRIASRGASIK